MKDISDFVQPQTKVEDLISEDGSPIPPGNYVAIIESAELKETNKKNGWMLKFQFRIQGPKQANRVCWDQLLLSHPSEDAVRIAKEKLGKLCQSAGLSHVPAQAATLVGKRLGLTLKIRNDPQHGESNEVTAYIPTDRVGGATPAPPVGSGAGQQFNDDDLPF